MSIAEAPRAFGLRDQFQTPWKLALWAYVLIALALLVDVVTPQTLNAEVLYAVPVVLAAFSPSRKLTYRLVLVAIMADEIGAIADAALDGFHWEIIGIENRFLSLVSLATVAALTLAVQQAASRIGSLSAVAVQRRRHAALSSAADSILASLGSSKLDAAIAVEAARVLERPTMLWCPAGQDCCWSIEERDPHHARLSAIPAEYAEFVRPAQGDREAELLTLPEGPSPEGKRRARSTLLRVPIADQTTVMGVLLAPAGEDALESGLLVIAASFASLVVGALQQSRLIADLATRNRALNEKQGVIQGLIDAIAHDLRTPLAALSVTLQQAGDGAYGQLPGEYAGVLRESKSSIDEISRLSETLLLVARLESGARCEVRGRVRFDAVVRELASEFGAMASARGVRIVTPIVRPGG